MNSGKLAPPTAVTINSMIETGYAHAEELRSSDARRAALLHQSTLALHMALELGMRRSALTMIDVRTDLHCDGTGRVKVVSFADGRSMKACRLEWPLSAWLRECLQRHLEVHWPRITSKKSTQLFPHGMRVIGAHRIRRAIAELLLTTTQSINAGDAQ